MTTIFSPPGAKTFRLLVYIIVKKGGLCTQKVYADFRDFRAIPG